MQPVSGSSFFLFSSLRGRRAPREKEKTQDGGLPFFLLLVSVSLSPLLFSPTLSLFISTHRVPGDSALAGGAGLAGVLGLLDRGLERGLGVGLGDDGGAERGGGSDAAGGEGKHLGELEEGGEEGRRSEGEGRSKVDL